MKKLNEIGPFRGDQKPVRDGVYKRFFPQFGEKLWCLFSKGRWYCSALTHSGARRSRVWPSAYQDEPWYGVGK